MKYVIYGIAPIFTDPEFRMIAEFITEYLRGLTFPFVAVATGESGDSGEDVVRFPNDNEMSLLYFEFKRLVENS
jgi:hypothetical protein